jgi:hypothetical protein
MGKYIVGVTCDYSEGRVVYASSEAEAIRKAKKGDYVAVLTQDVGQVRLVDSVTKVAERKSTQIKNIKNRCKK